MADMRRKISAHASSLVSKLHLTHSDVQVTLEQPTPTEGKERTRKLVWPPDSWFSPVSPLHSPDEQQLAPAPRSNTSEARPRSENLEAHKLSVSSFDGPITFAGQSDGSGRTTGSDNGDAESVQLVDEPDEIERLTEKPGEQLTAEPETVDSPVDIMESPAEMRAPISLGSSRETESPQAGPSRASPVSTPPTTAPASASRPSTPRSIEKSPLKQGYPFPTTPLHPVHRSTGSEVKETLGARTSTHHDGTRMLNQYILLQTLGRGAFGLVLEAVDAETGEEYAIKELNRARLRRRAQKDAARKAREVRAQIATTEGKQTEPHPVHETQDERTATQTDALYLVRNEIAIMKKVNHPNVVRLFEVLDAPSEDALYMVLELCSGGPIMTVSLDPAHPSEPLDVCEAHEFFRQIVSGVAYLHHNEIVHHDIKPDNILLTADRKTVKLVDFGVSVIFEKPGDDSFRDGTPAAGVASPAFAAPEQFGFNQTTGFKGIHGRAADIWSLGVSLYCMLTGHLPFEDRSMLGLCDAIAKAAPKIPDSWSPDLIDLICQLLDKDPQTRIKMEQLREHPWVTDDGQRPLPPIVGKDATPMSPVTQADLDEALFVGLHSLRQQFHEAVACARAASKQHAETYGDRIGDGKRRAFFRALRSEIMTRGAASKKDFERSWLEWRERSRSRGPASPEPQRVKSNCSTTSVVSNT